MGSEGKSREELDKSNVQDKQNKDIEDDVEEKRDTGGICQIPPHFNLNNPVTVEGDEQAAQNNCFVN